MYVCVCVCVCVAVCLSHVPAHERAWPCAGIKQWSTVVKVQLWLVCNKIHCCHLTTSNLSTVAAVKLTRQQMTLGSGTRGPDDIDAVVPQGHATSARSLRSARLYRL